MGIYTSAMSGEFNYESVSLYSYPYSYPYPYQPQVKQKGDGSEHHIFFSLFISFFFDERKCSHMATV